MALIEMSRQQRLILLTTPYVRQLQELIEQGMTEEQAEDALTQKED